MLMKLPTSLLDEIIKALDVESILAFVVNKALLLVIKQMMPNYVRKTALNGKSSKLLVDLSVLAVIFCDDAPDVLTKVRFTDPHIISLTREAVLPLSRFTRIPEAYRFAYKKALLWRMEEAKMLSASLPQQQAPLELRAGNLCEALDTYNHWHLARIVSWDDNYVLVHFLPWTIWWDEMIPRDKVEKRLAPVGTQSQAQSNSSFWAAKRMKPSSYDESWH